MSFDTFYDFALVTILVLGAGQELTKGLQLAIEILCYADMQKKASTRHKVI